MNSWLGHPIKIYKINNSDHHEPITIDFFRDSIVKDLPPHLIHEILLRSPAESLLRFKSVCKDWLSLIKDPKFVKQHFDHHKANNQSIGIVFIYANRAQEFYLYLTIFNKLWDYGDVPSNEMTTTDKFRVYLPTAQISKLTSCNGLLCFHTEFPLLMVNPITKEILELPKPRIEAKKEEASACGFGFDAKKNVYKVVQLKRCFSNSSLVCEVLELSTTMSWRKIQHQPSFPYPFIGEPNERPEPVFVEGSINWLAFKNIFCFDVAAEKFKMIPEPYHQKAECGDNCTTFLVELDRSLCLMTHGISSGMVCIWKMQKDSDDEKPTWIKSYSFSTRRIRLKNIHIKSLCMRRKKIYLKYRKGLACYDTERQKLIAPVFNRVADNNLGAVAYTKSVVCLRDIVGSSILRLRTV